MNLANNDKLPFMATGRRAVYKELNEEEWDQVKNFANKLEKISSGEVGTLTGAIPDLMLLISFLKEPDETMVSNIVGYIASQGEKVIGHLIPSLHHPNKRIRNKIISVLGQIQSELVVAPLLDFLETYDGEFLESILEALKNVGGPSIPALLNAFNEASPTSQYYIAYALWELGDERAIEKLILLLFCNDPDVCGTTAMALAEIGSDQALEALVESLIQNSDKILEMEEQGEPLKTFTFLGIRAHVATALVKIGIPCVPLLVDTLDNASNPHLYETIVSILGKVGDRQAVSSLLRLADYYTQLEQKFLLKIIEAMKNIKDFRCVPILTKILWDKNSEKKVLEAVVHALGNIPAGEQAIIRSLTHSDSMVRFYAIAMINKKGQTKAVKNVFPLLKDPSPLVSGQAMSTLEKFAPQTLPIVFELMTLKPEKMKQQRGKLLRNISQTALKNVRSEKPEVQKQAVDVLEKIVNFYIK